MKPKIYTVGEAAEILRVSIKTLQRWDRAKIFVAQRTPTGRRFYTQEQIESDFRETPESAEIRRQRDIRRQERLKSDAVKKFAEAPQETESEPSQPTPEPESRPAEAKKPEVTPLAETNEFEMAEDYVDDGDEQ